MSLLTPAQEANARSVLSNVRSGIDAIKASNPMLSSQPNVSTNPSLNNTGVTPTASTNVQSNAPDFTMPKRDVVPSSSLIGGLSLSEILDTRKQLQRQVLEANKPTQNELDLTDQLNATKKLSRDAQVEYRRQEERLLGQGGATREQTTPFISETAKSYQRSLADVGTSQSGLADLLEAEINKRKSNVDYATGLLNADKENISMLQDLQKSTRPDVLSTQVNDLTGDVTAFIQDSMGGITSQNIGNVGAKKQYVQSGTYQDASGNQVFWGMNPSGQIETKNLGGGKIPPSSNVPIINTQNVDFSNPDTIRNLPVSYLTKAVMSGTMKLKDLTPTDKSQVATEMYQSGFNPQQYVVNKLTALATLWSNIEDSNKGLLNYYTTPFASSRFSDVAEFESARQLLTREIARLNDVGVLSDPDVESYQKAMPSRRDESIDVVNAKIKGLTSATDNTQGVSRTSGGNSGQTSSGLKYTIEP